MWTGEVRGHCIPGEAESDRRHCFAAQSPRGRGRDSIVNTHTGFAILVMFQGGLSCQKEGKD